MTDSNDIPTGGHSHPTSPSLLVRARNNDPLAWRCISDLYGPLVNEWCRQWGLQEADAADVCQEVLAAVSQSLDDFRHGEPGTTFRGWLRRISRGKYADHHRRRAAEPAAAGGAELLEGVPSPGAEPEPAALALELDAIHRRALALIAKDFEEKTWRAFLRTVVDGQPGKAVAAELEMSSGAVYTARSRVLARLRAEFEGLLED